MNQTAALNTHLLKLRRTQRSNSTNSCTGAQLPVCTCSHEAQTHQHLTVSRSGSAQASARGLFICTSCSLEFALAAEADGIFLPRPLPSFQILLFPAVFFFCKCNFSSFCCNRSLFCLHFSSLPSPTIQWKCAHLHFFGGRLQASLDQE